MMTDTQFTQGPNVTRSAIRQLIAAGVVAAVLASLANVLVYYFLPALFGFALEFPLQGPGSEVGQLPVFMVVMATVIGAMGGTVVLGILKRFTGRPATLFRRIALAFLLLSFGAPFSLPAPLPVRLTLATMHVIAAGVITTMLTARLRN